MNKHFFTKGLTLLETVIVIAITVLIMLSLVTLYVKFNALYLSQESYSASAYHAGAAVNALGAAILPASTVVASHTFSGTAYSSGSSELVLSLPSVDASGAIVVGAVDHIGFYLSGTDLYRVTDPSGTSARVSGTKHIASLVSTLTFTYDDADFAEVTEVGVSITTEQATQQGPATTTLEHLFYLRNR